MGGASYTSTAKSSRESGRKWAVEEGFKGLEDFVGVGLEGSVDGGSMGEN